MIKTVFTRRSGDCSLRCTGSKVLCKFKSTSQAETYTDSPFIINTVTQVAWEMRIVARNHYHATFMPPAKRSLPLRPSLRAIRPQHHPAATARTQLLWFRKSLMAHIDPSGDMIFRDGNLT
jgi:hypothetical protein